MDFKHEIIELKHKGDKNDVDENVSIHGMHNIECFDFSWRWRRLWATRSARSRVSSV